MGAEAMSTAKARRRLNVIGTSGLDPVARIVGTIR
jgi:hypothetical protein